jgi:pimeloyl-ACP methyl ester carboxylesterase
MTSIHIDLLGTETRYYDTGNYRTRVIEIANDRMPLLLLHGGGGHAEAFARNIVPLSAVSRPMAMDFIWHGLSSKPSFWSNDPTAERHWLNQFTDQVLELMDHCGFDRVVLEGESLGGWIAFDMGIRFPDRLAGLVLNTAWGMALDPAKVEEVSGDLEALKESSLAGLNNPTPEAIRARMEWLMPLGGVTDEVVDVRCALWSRPDTRAALTEYYEMLFHRRIDEYMFGEDDIAKITAKTLVLWTDHNPLHGVDAARRLGELIPNSTVEIIDNAGHWPQWERPEEHDRIVAEFIRSL